MTRRPSGIARRLLLALGVCAAAAVAVGLSNGGAASDAALTAAVAAQATSPRPSSPPAQPPGTRGVPPPLAPTPGQPPVERGRQLFLRGCAGCHGQDGSGSDRGPDLRGVGAASTDFQLSTGRMPLAAPVKQPPRAEPAYDQGDIDALVAYIDSLAGARQGQPIPHPPSGDLQDGRRLYLTNCASCHSSSGAGSVLPDGYVAPRILAATPRQVAEAVRVGPGVMPQFPEGVLSDQQVGSIVSYVQAIPPHDDHGGWPIGGLGPLTEGLVGWLVGLGLLGVVIRLLGRRSRG